MGRGHLELVRPAHSDPGPGPSCPEKRPAQAPVFIDSAPEPAASRIRHGREGRPAGGRSRACGPPRFFQPGVGAVSRKGRVLSPGRRSACPSTRSISRRTTHSGPGCWIISSTASPILCTEGDFFSERVAKEGVGLTVPAEDIGALEAAILKLAGDDDLRRRCRARLSLLKSDFEWEKPRPLSADTAAGSWPGRPSQTSRLSRRDARALFRPRRPDLFRRLIQNRHLWPALQKLPARISVKLKRLWT